MAITVERVSTVIYITRVSVNSATTTTLQNMATDVLVKFALITSHSTPIKKSGPFDPFYLFNSVKRLLLHEKRAFQCGIWRIKIGRPTANYALSFFLRYYSFLHIYTLSIGITYSKNNFVF